MEGKFITKPSGATIFVAGNKTYHQERGEGRSGKRWICSSKDTKNCSGYCVIKGEVDGKIIYDSHGTHHCQDRKQVARKTDLTRQMLELAKTTDDSYDSIIDKVWY